MSLCSARVTQFFQVGVHGVQSVVCAFSEVMASTGRAGPGFLFTGPGRYFNNHNGPGRIGPKFYRAGSGREFSARAEHYSLQLPNYFIYFNHVTSDPSITRTPDPNRSTSGEFLRGLQSIFAVLHEIYRQHHSSN